MPGPKRRPLAERLWAKVERKSASECWPWRGSTNGRYGRIAPGGDSTGRSPIGAHVAAWIVTHGPVPPGKCVCHTCDFPLCCNPGHLFLGTVGDNNRDASRKGRAHWTRTVRDNDGRFTEEIAA